MTWGFRIHLPNGETTEAPSRVLGRLHAEEVRHAMQDRLGLKVFVFYVDADKEPEGRIYVQGKET